MARCRTGALAALVMTAFAWTAPAPAVAAPAALAGVVAGQPAVPAQYYYAPRPRQRVCWNERVRRFVGYDRYGRAVYRNFTRRVCR
mgnify:CR=1 FL=1